ncbi:MAG: T9SS type A sorting domain-containing protein [Saprospirales bacterium]|nr:T9SS type A sorting domain-containing protein [Saprospirales bacterium]
MRIRTTLLFTLLWLCPALRAQTLVSSTLLGSKTKAQLASQFNLPIFQYGVKYYRITYTTTGVQGLPDTASGLVVVPDDASKVYPRLVYQHGTSGTRYDVPSFNVLSGGEGTIGQLFGGLGYVALLPDYLGLGLSDGFHPYVHAESEASVAIDMLRALPAFSAQYGLHTNAQLFMTGYSQGGHASMALHRKVETELQTEFTATAAAHLSGPYSIGEVMRALILSDSVYLHPAYLPNTILSYQKVYGNLFGQISEVFKAPYATPVAAFYNGTITLNQLNSQLISLLTANEGASRPLRMLQPDVVQEVRNDPDHPFNIALRANNVYDWAPAAPTRIFYCMADDQVPYLNSIVARDSMLALGAANLVATDVKPGANHGGCVEPALSSTLFFFAGYQQVGVFTAAGEPAVQPLTLQPNPATAFIRLEQLPAGASVRIVDLGGRLCLASCISASGTAVLDISGLGSGLYLVRCQSENAVWLGKLIVQH